MGIGAMIVFIAMVLVAGIAASVIVQTANRLEMQSMTSGQETTGEVSSGIGVLDIEGHRTGVGLDRLMISVETRAASRDIDLSQVYIEISDGNRKCLLSYLPAEFHDKSEVAGNMYNDTFFNNLTATTFGVIVNQDSDGSFTRAHPVLNYGDMARLTLVTSSCFGGVGLTPRTDVFGLIQPEQGAPGFFGFRTPFLNANTLYLVY